MGSHRGHHSSTAGTSTPIPEHEQWRQQAACRGMSTDLFYPPDGMRGMARHYWIEEAKSICADCTVTAQCWEAARTEKYGVWAGVDKERRRLGQLEKKQAVA